MADLRENVFKYMSPFTKINGHLERNRGKKLKYLGVSQSPLIASIPFTSATLNVNVSSLYLYDDLKIVTCITLYTNAASATGMLFQQIESVAMNSPLNVSFRTRRNSLFTLHAFKKMSDLQCSLGGPSTASSVNPDKGKWREEERSDGRYTSAEETQKA